MTPKRIHLIFKTHLDIGFTGYAAQVRAQYHEHFLPQALDTAEHFFYEDRRAPKFVWTTGSWLIWDHLNSRSAPEVARLERAIRNGLVRWHALAFTTHSELMSPAVFRAALSYCAELDAHFKTTTRAAKMTDVPGHTRGIIPLLNAAGIRFLHIGINTATPRPDVPGLFRWRASDGSELVVMVEHSYGDTSMPEGLSEGLSFAHTLDNSGPQSVSQVVDVYRNLAKAYPGVPIRAGSLEAFGALAWNARQTLPLVTAEIGDSWIYGAASDPHKSARYRALQRLYDRFEKQGLTERRLAFGRRLAMVAEHTCGVDIKTYLRDETAWDRPDFERAQNNDPRFRFVEGSWAEQRQFLDSAVAALDGADRAQAQRALAKTVPAKTVPAKTVPAKTELAMTPPPAPPGLTSAPITSYDLAGWHLQFDEVTGDLAAITTPAGQHIDGARARLFGFRHQIFAANDIKTHLDSYLQNKERWAILDLGKPGLERAKTAHSETYKPQLTGCDHTDGAVRVCFKMPEQAHARYGAPEHGSLVFSVENGALGVALCLYNKPANRLPEAGFLNFTPLDAYQWSFEKTGERVDAGDVVANNGGQLHAIFAAQGICDAKPGLEITNLDSALAGPYGHDFMLFSRQVPDYCGGLAFNLYNNKWGTNFPMWWSGDVRFRFCLKVN